MITKIIIDTSLISLYFIQYHYGIILKTELKDNYMKKLLAFIAIVGLLTTGLSAAESDMVTLKTIEGKMIHIKGTPEGLNIPEYKGKVVFLEFWGTHCPPCKMSIPYYINLVKKYKDKLAMLAIEVQSTPKAQLKKFVESRKINYDVVAYADAIDFVDYISQRAQWQGSIPFLLIFDKEGKVVTMQVGLLSEDALAGIIEKLSADSGKAKSSK